MQQAVGQNLTCHSSIIGYVANVITLMHPTTIDFEFYYFVLQRLNSHHASFVSALTTYK